MALEAVVFQQDLFGYNTKDVYNLVGGSGSGSGNWPSYHDFGQLQKQQQELEEEEKEEEEYFLDNQTPLLLSTETTNNFLHGDHWVTSTTCSHSSPTTNSSMVLPPHNYHHHHHHHHHQLHHHPNSLSSSDAAATTTTNNNVGSITSVGGGGGGDPSSSAALLDSSATTCNRPKRRRAKSRKNKEEIENQRMTHIAVERNRRKQMNEYLSVLRSLMPDSYVQRGDQASIIGGAINFVKELEQRLQWLSGQSTKEVKDQTLPFAEFFTFPQYSTTPGSNRPVDSSTAIMNDHHHQHDQCGGGGGGGVVGVGDIEVTMVESHANLKIRSKRRSGQLLKLVAGLNTMRLTILHLNLTTVDQTVLYSLSLKVEDDCKLTSVDDIATAVNQLLGRIQE